MKKLKLRRGTLKKAAIHFKRTQVTISNWLKEDNEMLLKWILEQEELKNNRVEKLKNKINKVLDAKN